MGFPIQEAFQKFYPEYRQSHTVTAEQEKAAQCIMGCKTGTFGYTASHCPECGHIQIHSASCGNRNCPCCQGTKKEEWVAARNSELIDGIPYFHIVFTVPAELNSLMLENQKLLFGLLMKSASGAVLELAARPKNLGAVPGIVSVLHTWGSNLAFHPHIHMMVSGGGLQVDNPSRFLKTPDRTKEFFVPNNQLAGAFRANFLSGLKAMRSEGSLSYSGDSVKYRNHYNWEELLSGLYHKKWGVFLKETFNGNGNAIEYLSRYSFRTAISNSRIITVTDTRVVFIWTDYKDGGKKKKLSLTGTEFVRRFLMHVLPAHFTRIRFSGFLCNARKKKSLEQICRILRMKPRENKLKGSKVRDRILILFGRDICQCPECGGTMTWETLRRPIRAVMTSTTLTKTAECFSSPCYASGT